MGTLDLVLVIFSSALIIFGGLLILAGTIFKAIKGLPGWKDPGKEDEEVEEQKE